MKTVYTTLLLLILTIFVAADVSAQPSANTFRLEGNVVFSMFQQQIKSEIGADRGQRLVFERELGAVVSCTYGILDFASVGIFVRAGIGDRENAQFDGFDSNGKTQVKNQLGGSYSELWIGPLVHLHWKQFFLDGGYALYGKRTDNGRSDIYSTTGDNTSSFRTSPSFAFLIGAGGNLPVADNLSVVLKVDFCIRYYDQRGGEPLAGDIVHGTQSLAPSIGIAWIP